MKTMKKLLCVILALMFVLPGMISLGMTASATDFEVGDFIQFGSYPQSKVEDSTLIAALEERSVSWQSYGYFSGEYKVPYLDSDGKMTASNYMQYADVSFEGEKYRGVRFVQYRPSQTGCVSSAARSGQDENGYYISTTYWFMWEPLRWHVLDPDTGLVLCESAIDSQTFNNYRKTSGQDDYGYDADWGDADKTYYANNYAMSDIRAWLTDESDAGSFLNMAFTLEQRERIYPTELDNSAYRTEVSDYDSASTTDRIFLLSWNDAQNPDYGFFRVPGNESETRLVQGTDYAKCQGLPVNYTNSCSAWRLRTAGASCRHACYVTAKGTADVYGIVDGTNVGIRPAARIDLDYAYATAVYKAKFVADGALVATVKYKAETTSIQDQEPAVPAKTGYAGAWKPYSLLLGGVTVEAEYTPIEYDAVFIADGKPVETVKYTVETTSITEPAVPEKAGYTGAWAPYTLAVNGVQIEAEYTPVVYEAQFVADDEPVETIPYTVETQSITEPDVPAKPGYTGAWAPYTLAVGGVTVEAEYTPVEYDATFIADGVVVKTVKYTVETESITEPAVPKKEGYAGAWKPYTLAIGGVTIEAEYTVVDFDAVFYADGKLVGTVPYTVGMTSITEPAVPAKPGYTGAWKPYTLAVGGVTVEAEYTPIEYDAVFNADGKPVGTVKYTVETTSITEPAVPAKEGYTGAWAPYTLAIDGVTIEAEYTPVEYDAVFIADGKPVGTVKYTVETTSITEPAVPKKDGFVGSWKPYTLAIGGVTIEAEYEVVGFTAEFYADDKLVGTVNYTVETTSIKDKEPAVPEKPGYTGAWKPYTLSIGGVRIDAKYTAIRYTAKFVADGRTISTVTYTVETESIRNKEPAVPAKAGYTGAWKPYTLDIGGVTIEAEYTPIEYTAEFFADGSSVGTVTYTVETTSITEPAVPAKTGYTGAWKPYTLIIGGTRIDAQYTPDEYTAEFIADGTTVDTVTYTVETTSITEPAVPAKEGYTGAWKPYTLSVGGVRIEAEYTVNTYTVTWSVDGQTTKTSVAFGAAIVKPADPRKEGFTFTGWTPAVPATMPAQDMVFTAQFTQNQYNAILMADGRQVAVIPYTFGQKSIDLPAVPEKEGYTGTWPSYTLPVGGVTITAVYTKNNYTVTWIADGKSTQTTVTYGGAITKPADPTKDGYVFRGWDPAVPATMPAKNLTFTAQFEKAVVTGLRITKLPDKTVYTYRKDQNIDLSGMTLEATYSDGSRKTVTDMSKCKVSGYSAKPRGDKTVLVEYEGQTVQFNVTVKYKWWQWLILIFLLGFIWY